MLLQFKTQSGSLYEIEGDQHGGTWKRLEHHADSKYVRTDDGVYNTCSPIVLGDSVTLVCPPFVDGALARIIITTPVAEIIIGDGIEEIA